MRYNCTGVLVVAGFWNRIDGKPQPKRTGTAAVRSLPVKDNILWLRAMQNMKQWTMDVRMSIYVHSMHYTYLLTYCTCTLHICVILNGHPSWLLIWNQKWWYNLWGQESKITTSRIRRFEYNFLEDCITEDLFVPNGSSMGIITVVLHIKNHIVGQEMRQGLPGSETRWRFLWWVTIVLYYVLSLSLSPI